MNAAQLNALEFRRIMSRIRECKLFQNGIAQQVDEVILYLVEHVEWSQYIC